MMSLLRTCLVVCDDPDDYQLFMEAIKEVSVDIIVLCYLEGSNLLQVLSQEVFAIDYLFVDLTLINLNSSSHVKELEKILYAKNIRTLFYGDKEPAFVYVQNIFMKKNASYSEIKATVKKIMIN